LSYLRRHRTVPKGRKEPPPPSPARRDLPVLLVPLDHKVRKEPQESQDLPVLLDRRVLMAPERRDPKGCRVLLALMVLSALLVLLGLVALIR